MCERTSHLINLQNIVLRKFMLKGSNCRGRTPVKKIEITISLVSSPSLTSPLFLCSYGSTPTREAENCCASFRKVGVMKRAGGRQTAPHPVRKVQTPNLELARLSWVGITSYYCCVTVSAVCRN